MSAHVTAEQIGQYRGKTMPAAELLAFDRHLARCEACRGLLAEKEAVSRLLSGLAAAAPEHLSYERMADYVDGKLAALDREAIESHAEMCGRCAAELEDLAAFVRANLADFKAPRALVTVAELGRAPNGKLDYKALLMLATDKVRTA